MEAVPSPHQLPTRIEYGPGCRTACADANDLPNISVVKVIAIICHQLFDIHISRWPDKSSWPFWRRSPAPDMDRATAQEHINTTDDLQKPRSCKRVGGYCNLKETLWNQRQSSVNPIKHIKPPIISIKPWPENERSQYIPRVLEAVDYFAQPRLISLNYPALKPGEMTVATRSFDSFVMFCPWEQTFF